METDRMHKIEVDKEVYDFLKKNAEPFVDNPNKVLRRLLSLGKTKSKPLTIDGIPEFRPAVPSALEQILQVLSLVKNKRCSRLEATRKVAEARGITYQAVIDKYTRQLGKKAFEIDEMLMELTMTELKTILKEEFPLFTADINRVLGD